jgi:hypothetical protein
MIMAAVSNAVPVGRRMNGAEMFMAFQRQEWRLRLKPPRENGKISRRACRRKDK